MEVLHKIISSHQISPVFDFFDYLKIISKDKDCESYHPIMECFSEKIWKMFSEDWFGYECDGKEGNYRFSPGKMHKNFIKIYWFEMPLDYIILEVDDMEFEKLQAKEFKEQFAFMLGKK
jgi:hypothetical protein